MLYRELSVLSRAIKNKLTWSRHKSSPMVIEVLDSLWRAKLILGYSFQKKFIIVFLKYDTSGDPVIKEFRIVSTPGRRVSKGFLSFIGSPSNNLFILKTSLGVLQDYEAKKRKIGGEVLLKIIH